MDTSTVTVLDFFTYKIEFLLIMGIPFLFVTALLFADAVSSAFWRRRMHR